MGSLLKSFREPVSQAIAENATSPAGATPGVEIWSTTASKKLRWSGTAWVSASGSSGGGSNNVAFADIVNRRFPSMVNGVPSGSAQGTATQPADFDSYVRTYLARGAGLSNSYWGFSNVTFGIVTPQPISALSNVNDSVPSQKGEIHRVLYATGPTAGATAGWRSGSLDTSVSAGSYYGGFFFAARFGFNQASSAMHWFVGMMPAASVLSAAVVANSIGFAQDANSGLALVCNGTSLANTQYINEATSISRIGSTTIMYDVFLHNPRHTRDIYWGFRPAKQGLQPTLLRTYTVPSTTETVNAPAANGIAAAIAPVGLAPQCWTSNGTTAVSVGLEVASVYLETWG